MHAIDYSFIVRLDFCLIISFKLYIYIYTHIYIHIYIFFLVWLANIYLLNFLIHMSLDFGPTNIT